jgi:hypothetical protein
MENLKQGIFAKMKAIELLEKRYLNKYYHFLKSVEEELLEGFKTKEVIKDDWIGYYKSGISDFSVGAERIVYSLMNGRSIGIPNSCPVGSDLFFEVKDAFIHIDLKTVGASLEGKGNIGDFLRNIFVGTNQNSYKGNMIVNEEIREYVPSLPTRYNKDKSNEKICLCYFITILYDKDTLETLVINIICMPNGELEPFYKDRVLSAGKNKDKTRYNFKNTPDFELIGDNSKRIKVIYFNYEMKSEYFETLKYFEDLYKLN